MHPADIHYLLVHISGLLWCADFHKLGFFSQKTTAHMAADINDEIYNRIDTFIQVPYHMNEVNHKVIENGMLNLSDEKHR